MRMRMLSAAVLAGGLVVAAGAPAQAQDPGVKAGEHLVECVEDALSEHEAEIARDDYQGFTSAIEDCKKAPSLITPALPEIIWGALAFAIVALVLMKYAFPALKKGLAAREERIRQDLEGAEHAREEARAEKARYDEQLANARGEANRIIEEARLAAEGVRQEVVARAETEASEIRARAQDDIRLATERATSDLQHRVGDLSIELAEKIVERNLDRDTQRALIDSYIASVGGGRS
jgi:F-type H+-transporting ATPase subunit b